MGTLDEAIREHLALKRRQGLSDDELKRLEDEAFGPPARPGEPDFPDRDAEGAEGAEEAAAEEHEVLVEGAGEEAEALTHDEPAERGSEVGGAGHGETGEEELGIAELDLEPDLEREEDLAAPEPDAASELTGAPTSAELPIESLETVEHPVEEEPDRGEGEPEELDFDELESDDLDLAEGFEDDSGEAAADGEDVLEDTPEFLRDAPEDDELWFEQGEPKDFDF
jgi:hypothetical protein